MQHLVGSVWGGPTTEILIVFRPSSMRHGGPAVGGSMLAVSTDEVELQVDYSQGHPREISPLREKLDS